MYHFICVFIIFRTLIIKLNLFKIWVWHIAMVHRTLVIFSNSGYIAKQDKKIFLSPLYSKTPKYIFHFITCKT